MSGVLAYNVDSVVATGLYITVTSFYDGYTTGDQLDVRIVDAGPGLPADGILGASTGIMTKTTGLGTALLVSVFYSWYDLVGYTPDIVSNNHTTIEIFKEGRDFTASYSTANGLEFLWPGAGAGGVACFTANSKLLTPAGYVEASALRTGDLLVTADGRQVAIKAHTFTVKADKASAPYLVPKNSLARNIPIADLHLSPWHAISLGNSLWQKPQTAAELNPGSVTQYDIGKTVQYYHFEAPNYFTDNFICEGTVVESFGAKQVSGKEHPYTWSAKYKAYTRNNGIKNSKKSVGV